jgi:hypothetical protein
MRWKPWRGVKEEVDQSQPGIWFGDATNKESADGVEVSKIDTQLNNSSRRQAMGKDVWLKNLIPRLRVVDNIFKPLTIYCNNLPAILYATKKQVK